MHNPYVVSITYIFHLIQVAQLRQRFFQSIAPGGLAGDRRGVIPASGFSFSAQQIWKVIRENKDLDLPAHKVVIGFFLVWFLFAVISFAYTRCFFYIVICCNSSAHLQVMVATVRCEEIANEKLNQLTSDEVIVQCS